MNKNPREILRELVHSFCRLYSPPNCIKTTNKIDEACKEIDAFYKSNFPKKKAKESYSEEEMWENSGYNQAIADFHKEE